MATILNTNNIQIGLSTIWDGDINAIRKVYSQVDYGICFTNGLTWHPSIVQQNSARATGTMYVTRGVYKTNGALDAYNNPIPGINYPTNNSISTGYDTFSYTNSSLGRSIKILIYAAACNPSSFILDQHVLGLGAGMHTASSLRPTDDTSFHSLYRGGTPASATAHSGGTVLALNKTGSCVLYETIPANTTYTYWHYSNISGSSGDSHATRFYAEFQNFV
jgi:hypothetical protein